MQKSRHKFTLMSTARVERDHGRIYRRGNSILKTQLLSTWIAKDHSLRFSVSRPRREYAVCVSRQILRYHGRTTNREVQRNIPRYDGNVYIFITPNRVAFRNMHKLCKCAK